MLPKRIVQALLFLGFGVALHAELAMGQGAVQPTGPDELPAAIMGTAPAPPGQDNARAVEMWFLFLVDYALNRDTFSRTRDNRKHARDR